MGGKKKVIKTKKKSKAAILFYFFIPSSEPVSYLFISCAEGDTAGHARDVEVDGVGAEDP